MEKTQFYPAHIFSFRVPISYIDTGGVVYNGRYLDIYNLARDEYMRETGYPYIKLVNEDDSHLTVLEVNIQYKAPLYYDDRVNIKTEIEKIGTKSMIVQQFIYRENDKTLCNQARFVLVCVKDGFQSAPIPSNLIKAFQKGPVTPVHPPEK